METIVEMLSWLVVIVTTIVTAYFLFFSFKLMYDKKKKKIENNTELSEHLSLGRPLFFIILTQFLTDTSDGLMAFQLKFQTNSFMVWQYVAVLWALVEVIKHIKSRHYEFSWNNRSKQ